MLLQPDHTDILDLESLVITLKD